MSNINVLVEQIDEPNAPATKSVLSVGYTEPHEGEPTGLVYLAIGAYDEHNDGVTTGFTFDFPNESHVTLDPHDLLLALVATGVIQGFTV